jgi:hypothetical protein
LPAVILWRNLTLKTARKQHRVRVSIFHPDRDPLDDRTWRCLFRVAGLPRRRPLIRASFGVDPLQALVQALKHLRLELRLLKCDGFDLDWAGVPDFGLPPATPGEMRLAQWRVRRHKRRPPGT